MFQKLGGTQAIEGVVDEFYSRVFVDDEVKGFFEGIDKQRLKSHQVPISTVDDFKGSLVSSRGNALCQCVLLCPD